jgi:hypothetical protein
MSEKRCSGPCGQIKPITDFYRVGKSHYGKCKECFKRTAAKPTGRPGNKGQPKKCTACGKVKPIINFYKVGRSYSGKCKECIKIIGASTRVRYGPKKKNIEILGATDLAQEMLNNKCSVLEIAEALKVCPSTIRNYIRAGLLVAPTTRATNGATNGATNEAANEATNEAANEATNPAA